MIKTVIYVGGMKRKPISNTSLHLWWLVSSPLDVLYEVVMRNIFSLSNNEESDKSTTFLLFQTFAFCECRNGMFLLCKSAILVWGAKLLISVKRWGQCPSPRCPQRMCIKNWMIPLVLIDSVTFLGAVEWFILK